MGDVQDENHDGTSGMNSNEMTTLIKDLLEGAKYLQNEAKDLKTEAEDRRKESKDLQERIKILEKQSQPRLRPKVKAVSEPNFRYHSPQSASRLRNLERFQLFGDAKTEKTPLISSDSVNTMRSSLTVTPLTATPPNDPDVEAAIPGYHHAPASRRAESVAYQLFFLSFWVVWAYTVAIYNMSNRERLWSEKRNALNVLGLIGATAVGSFVGAVVCDKTNWKVASDTAGLLMFMTALVGTVYTVVLFARPAYHDGWLILHLLRWGGGIGAGMLLPIGVRLALISADKIADSRVRTIKFAKLLLVSVSAQFCCAIVSMAAYGLESMVNPSQVSNGTVPLCNNLTDNELEQATTAEQEKLMFHTVVMSATTTALIIYTAIRVHILNKERGEDLKNLLRNTPATSVLRFIWDNSRLLAAASVPWVFASAIFWGQMPISMIALEVLIMGVAEENWYQFHMMYVVILAIPGVVLGYYFVTRYQPIRVQWCGFGLLAAVSTVTTALRFTLDPSRSNENVIYGFDILTCIIITAGPQSSAFILACDTLPKYRPALFYGIAACLSQVGAVIGWYLFNVFIHELSVRDEICDVDSTVADDVKLKNGLLSIVLSITGAFASYTYSDHYSEEERKRRRENERDPVVIPHWELKTTEPGQFALKELGHGSFGAVKRALWNDSHHPEKYVALKLYKFGDQDNEIETLSRLSHPNVIIMYGWGTAPAENKGYTNNMQRYMVLEYMDHGTLRDYLEKKNAELETTRTNSGNPGMGRTEKELIKHGNEQRILLQHTLALDVAKALTYLHKNKVFHRDLKCENCLVDTKGVVKISDFGTARQFHLDRKVVASIEGTFQFHAPEQFIAKGGKVKADWAKVDVYAFGFLMFEIATSFRRLEEWLNSLPQFHKVGPNPPKLKSDDLVSDKFRNVLEKCFSLNAAERYSSEKIVNELKVMPMNVKPSNKWFKQKATLDIDICGSSSFDSGPRSNMSSVASSSNSGGITFGISPNLSPNPRDKRANSLKIPSSPLSTPTSPNLTRKVVG